MATYKVLPGDTLSSIAQTHHTTIQALSAANPGIDPQTLQIGKVLHMPSSSSSSSNSAPPRGNGYVQYGGPAASFPSPAAWASYDAVLWPANQRLLKMHDSDGEIADIKKAIETVARESGVDRRVILCIILQESAGDVRADSVSNKPACG